MMLAEPRYQDGFLAGAALRAVRLGGLPAAPLDPTPPAPVISLTFEEQVKRTLHPQDAWPRLLEAAAANRPPGPEDAFRFRWFGLHDLAPKKDGFRLRLRLPGGRLTSQQMRAVADAAQEFASGCAEINSLAGLDIETLSLRDAPEALQRLEAAGLTMHGAGGDVVTALLADPMAGIDPEEVLDATPLVDLIAKELSLDPKFSDLPNGVTVFLAGSRRRANTRSADVSFQAIAAEAGKNLPAQIHFRVALAGAGDLGVMIPPEDAARVCTALLEIYRREADRSDRQNSQFASFAEKYGAQKWVEQIERLLTSKLSRAPKGIESDALAEKTASPRSFGQGVFYQRQPGLHCVAIQSPSPRLLSSQWLDLATLAEQHGGEMRLTASGGLLMPGVAESQIEPLRRTLTKQDWVFSPSRV